MSLYIFNALHPGKQTKTVIHTHKEAQKRIIIEAFPALSHKAENKDTNRSYVLHILFADEVLSCFLLSVLSSPLIKN